MKLKQLITALSLGFAAISASATPLDELKGSLVIKLTGLTTEFNTYNSTPVADRVAGQYYESTWGVGSITQISGTGGQEWNRGTSDGSYLYYMIYGIADQNVVYNADTGKFSIYNIGATAGAAADGKIHLDIYRSTKNLLEINSDYNASPSGRTGFDSYSLFADMGPAYLKVTFGTGKQLVDVACPATPNPAGAPACDPTANETLATLVQTVTAATLPAGGEGQFFADVVGGTAMSSWNNNTLSGHDFDGRFTLADNGIDPVTGIETGVCTQAQALDGTCFTGFINDPIRATKIPEPGSLALLGLGFAGLAGLRRRRAAK